MHFFSRFQGFQGNPPPEWPRAADRHDSQHPSGRFTSRCHHVPRADFPTETSRKKCTKQKIKDSSNAKAKPTRTGPRFPKVGCVIERIDSQLKTNTYPELQKKNNETDWCRFSWISLKLSFEFFCQFHSVDFELDADTLNWIVNGVLPSFFLPGLTWSEINWNSRSRNDRERSAQLGFRYLDIWLIRSELAEILLTGLIYRSDHQTR